MPTTSNENGIIKPKKGILTRRQIEVLKIMVENEDNENGEIVYEKGVGYIGLEKISSRTLFALLRCCCISQDSYNSGCEHYYINSTGKEWLQQVT